MFCVWYCEYEMVDEKIICLWNIDENKGYLCWKNLIRQSIDFSINGLTSENGQFKDVNITTDPPTPYKIKVNNCKLINLVIRIDLTLAILMPQFSNFLRNPTIHFRMFSYLVTCFLSVTVSLLCRSQGGTIWSPFAYYINAQIPKLDEIKLLIENEDLDILCISETWLQPNILDDLISIKNYNVFRNDNPLNSHGSWACLCICQEHLYL